MGIHTILPGSTKVSKIRQTEKINQTKLNEFYCCSGMTVLYSKDVDVFSQRKVQHDNVYPRTEESLYMT